MEGQVVTLQDIFAFDYSAGLDERGRFKGSLRPTGIRPQFSDRLTDHGVELPQGIFGMPEIPGAPSLRRNRKADGDRIAS